MERLNQAAPPSDSDPAPQTVIDDFSALAPSITMPSSPHPFTSSCGSVCTHASSDIMAQNFELVVDKRERHLLALLGDGGVQAATLELGDVLCKYPDGSCWVAERKSTQDLANSIKDGRWGILSSNTCRASEAGESFFP